MDKLSNKILDKVNNGYGINQAMLALGIEKKDVVELMSADEELLKKLQKRYAGTAWIDNVKFRGTIQETPETDTPELAALKEEAKELGIEFHPKIGYETLKKRVDEYKSNTL